MRTNRPLALWLACVLIIVVSARAWNHASNSIEPSHHQLSAGTNQPLQAASAQRQQQQQQDAAAGLQQVVLRDLQPGSYTPQELPDPLGLRPLINSEPVQPQSAVHRRLQQTLADARYNIETQRQPTNRPSYNVYSLIDVDSAGAAIPASFLGISHEWDSIEELATTNEYIRLLQDLSAYGTGPLILRVGGSSTDAQAAVAPQYVWDAFKKMNSALGMQFILGVNFLSGNVSLARAQMAKARETLPSSSILSFEVGNEPNYYSKKQGRTGGDYLNCCFVNDWKDFATALSCFYPPKNSCWYNQLAGPAWGHIQIKPGTLDWFLSRTHLYLNTVTMHWYKATSQAYNTPETLLEEGPLRTDMAFLRQSVQIAAKYKKPVRVAEMNSISNSGRRGVSNSFAAALWSLDGALEVAAAGATGVNLHWGTGATVYTAIIRRKAPNGRILPPLVMTPFYAYLMFQMAAGSGSRLLQQNTRSSSGSRVKVWPLVEDKTRSARIVLINKHPSAGAEVVLEVTKKQYADGKLIRMVARNGLSTTVGTDVTIGNVTYQVGGSPLGLPAGERVPRQWPPSGRLGYTVYVPAASAALLVLPRA